MNIIEIINSNLAYIMIGLFVGFIILLIMVILLLTKQRKLNIKYTKFMTGATCENLEGQVLSRFADIDDLKKQMKKAYTETEKIKDNLCITFQKVGVVKYDAFKEMGGKLSFVMVILDKNNRGILLNSVHSSREGCYTYLKEIIKGESFLELSEDERKALNLALNSSNFLE